MSRQFENVFVNPSNDSCMVICSCGEPSHGSIHLNISPGVAEGQAWWERWHCWLTVTVVPFPRLKERIKQAWGVLRGRPWEGDFELSANEGRFLGEWLTKHAMECLHPDGSVPGYEEPRKPEPVMVQFHHTVGNLLPHSGKSDPALIGRWVHHMIEDGWNYVHDNAMVGLAKEIDGSVYSIPHDQFYNQARIWETIEIMKQRGIVLDLSTLEVKMK